MNGLTHISLFAGIGGDTLAAEWAGFRTVLLCEIDSFCKQVLRKHFPGVPIIGDIKDVTRETIANTKSGKVNQRIRRNAEQEAESGESINPAVSTGNQQTITDTKCLGVNGESTSRTGGNIKEPSCPETRTRNQSDVFPLTLLSAGVPCQPASVAGKRRGKADDRWLWPEAIRVLSELLPTWAVFENPTGIGSLGELGGLLEMGSELPEAIPDREAVELDNICGDIEKAGYEVQPVCIPACAIGAPHQRYRIFIIAHSNQLRGRGWNNGNSGRGISESRKRLQRYKDDSKFNSRKAREVSSRGNQPDTHAEGEGLEGTVTEREVCRGGLPAEHYSIPDWQENWIEVATRLCGVDARISNRVDRLKALGNAIVPQQIYPIFKAIAEIENVL